MSDRVILHSDCNCFYASVEMLHRPELRHCPMAVGGDPEARHGIDECWLDVTCSERLMGNGMGIAQEIRQRIKKELGITVSVGVSFNKIFAKLGSDYKKPDAITTIFREEYQAKAWTLPVSDLLYVGRSTNNKLATLGIKTIGELAKMEDRVLHSHLGKMGLVLKDFANGLDDSPVRLEHTHAPVKSIGNSTTTSRDLMNDEDVQIVFYLLAESVAARLRENGFQCKVVEISVRDNGLYHFSRQRKLDHVTNITSELAEVAFSIFKSNYTWEKPIRSLGLRGYDLVVGNVDEQLSLFVDIEYQDKLRKMDEAVDDIRRRFGYFSVQRGLMYCDKSLSSLDCNGSCSGYFFCSRVQ